MARIRTIKPEFWSSPGLPTDPWERLLFVAMWNWADDYGIGTANERELLAFAFPNDPQIDSADLRRMLASVRRAFGVEFYTVAGRPYYAIPSWESHQKIDRRSARRNPGPEEAETHLYQPPPESPRDSPESPPISQRDAGVGKGTEDLGKGTEEVGTEEDDSPPEPSHFPPEPEFVDADVPEFIETGSKPSRQYPSSAAKTVVRQELGSAGYTREQIDRLAVQVDKLVRQDCPDVDIRESLVEWDRRENCDKPEYLITVYNDVVKRSRATPGNNGRPPHKMRTALELAAEIRAEEQAQLESASQRRAIE